MTVRTFIALTSERVSLLFFVLSTGALVTLTRALAQVSA